MLASWLQSIHGRVRVLIRPDNNRARDRLPVFQHTVANWQEKKHICSSCHSEERWSLKVNIKNKLKQILSGSVAGKKKKKKKSNNPCAAPPPLPCLFNPSLHKHWLSKALNSNYSAVCAHSKQCNQFSVKRQVDMLQSNSVQLFDPAAGAVVRLEHSLCAERTL